MAANLQPVASAVAADRVLVYVGTYTQGDSAGIYILELDPTSGQLTQRSAVSNIDNPSFLAIHPNRKFLYAVSEIGNYQGRPVGGVSAFAIDATSGDLTLLNQQSSVGAGPCHLVVDGSGRNVLVANYGGGSVACLPIGNDGRLGEATSSIQHQGSSVNARRQQEPHAHSINLDPANRFAIAADLGLDKLLIYRFDAAQGLLSPNDPPSTAVKAGAGPRHFAFHPAGKSAYVINELNSTITAFRWEPEQGALHEIQTISTLPDDFNGTSHTAEVVVSPDGKFVYGSNRGHDSIAIFAVDQADGKLTSVGIQSTMGKTPRNFAIDPSGNFLLAENQGSNSIVVFRIDKTTGQLKFSGQQIEIPSPVCVRFLAGP